jgi:hypothetical protein
MRATHHRPVCCKDLVYRQAAEFLVSQVATNAQADVKIGMMFRETRVF